MTERPDGAFDVAVLGGGPGGYVAAIRTSQLGLRVALVEREAVGGVCLNWGCIPTKALLRGAEVAHLVRGAAAFGVRCDAPDFDLAPAVDRSREVVGRVVRGVESLLERHGVTLLRTRGTLAGPGAIALAPAGEVLRADAVILATGAHPRGLTGVPVDGDRVLTSREALERRDLPRSIVIAGGGCVGVEFAYLYRAYGAEVTLVEVAPRLLPDMDAEIVRVLERSLRDSGIAVHTGTAVTGAAVEADGVRVRLEGAADGAEVRAERLLVAAGIEANTRGIGLEAAGVETDRGFIAVDGACRTGTPGVYAVGDVTGILPRAHVAFAQGALAAEAIAGLDPEPLDYRHMPRTVYARPEVAGIGLTEAEAREQGYEVTVGRFPYGATGNAVAVGEPEGLVKVVTDTATGEVLGCHIVGAEASELIAEVGAGMTLETTHVELGRTVHAHPTFSEAVREAALAVTGEAIHHYAPRRETRARGQAGPSGPSGRTPPSTARP